MTYFIFARDGTSQISEGIQNAARRRPANSEMGWFDVEIRLTKPGGSLPRMMNL
jgi:hypothetical protein